MGKKAKTQHHHMHLRPKLSLTAWLLIILSAVGGLVYIPISLLVVVGMAPTIIAFLFDQDERRSATIVIGLMNAAGVIPFVLKLCEADRTLGASMAILRHGMTWMIMYGSALSGWVILFIVPPIVHVIMVQKSRHRVAELERRQVTLREAWGEDVNNPSSTV